MKLKQKRVALIGLPILQSVNNLSNAAIARHAEDAGRWRFVFSAEATVSAFKYLRNLDCDGAIVRITSTAMLREAKKVHFPIVNISSWLEKPGVATVRHDYSAVGRLACEHLLEKGFRRFGCLTVPGGWYVQERLEAVQATLGALDCELKLFHLQTTKPMLPQPVAPAELKRFTAWVRQLQPPAGLILLDDWDAPELMKACREVGLEIPRDLVMISAGWHSEVLPLCPVPLSAVQEDQEMQARLAIACLDGLMADRQPRESIITVPPLGVMERASTATFAIEDREVAHAVEFIRAHAAEPINVASVVERVQIARVTLERRFRQVTGQTLHDFLVQQRVRRAQELLVQQPPLSLQSIAKQSGFPDRRRLNQVFHQVVGKSPAAWRSAPPPRSSLTRVA